MRMTLCCAAALLAACAASDPAAPEGGGGTGGTAENGGEGGAGGTGGAGPLTCDPPGPIALGSGAVSLAAAGDFDGDGRMDIVLARAGGLQAYQGDTCWRLHAGATALADATITGLDAGPLDKVAGDDVMAMTSKGALVALGGADLHALFTQNFPEVDKPGPVVKARLDLDADEDAEVFTAGYVLEFRMENTQKSWVQRIKLNLPGGIQNVRCGDLGGSALDELLFLGGGMVQVAGTTDFNYPDLRILSQGVHGAAAFGDLDGDGKPDAAITSDTALELWKGDGNTHISLAGSLPVALPVDVSITQTAPIIAVVLDSSGGLSAVKADKSGHLTVVAHVASGVSRPIRVFVGDVDGDTKPDAVAVGATGQAYVWRGLATEGN